MANNESRYHRLLKEATDEAMKCWEGSALIVLPPEAEEYAVKVFRCYRDGYSYYRQQWTMNGKRITKAEAEKALS